MVLAIISAVSAFISALSAIIAIVFLFKAETSQKIDMHLQFQKEIRNLQRQMPSAVNEMGWKPTNEDEDRLLYLYWYLVFDEWLVCTYGNRNLKKLWPKYYRNGVRSALKIHAFYEKISFLFEGGSEFMGYSKEFKEEINQICHEVLSHGL